jgi:hypothetical protein
MVKWTKQEQWVVLVFSVILLAGIAARAWRTAHPPSAPSPAVTHLSR